MIGYDDALAWILREAPPAPLRRVTPAFGQALGAAVFSEEYLPPFDNSAMDGFALRVGADGARAGAEFDLAGAQAAGDATAVATGADAWEIMTGARVPEGLDAVIPVEQVEVLARDGDGRPRRIRLGAAVPPGQHIRRRGEDLRQGAMVLAAGTRIEAAQLMLLAALGVDEVVAVEPPKVALLNTGRELVDDPRLPLASGQIRNSNGPYLSQRIIEAGAELVLRQTVSDDAAAFTTALQRALEAGAQLVVSTGAVSMGRHDFIPDALRALGAHIHFHKVNIRPGKPLLFASLPGGQAFFGLPGNPVSSAVGLRFFVEPMLRQILGLPVEKPLRVPLAQAYGKRHALRFHLKGRLVMDASGQLHAQVLPGQESFRIAPLSMSNGWIVLDEAARDLPAGASVAFWGPGHLAGLQLTGPGT